MNTTLVSSTPAHAAAVFGFALAPVIGLYLSHHGDMPLILTVGLLSCLSRKTPSFREGMQSAS